MSFLDSLKKSVGLKTPVPPSFTAPSANPIADEPAAKRGESKPPENRTVDWRALFVGPDEDWFHRVERDVRCLQPNWLCQREENVATAQAAMEKGIFHAVILDARLSGAANLVGKLARSICLVRCNISDRSVVTQWNRLGTIPVSQEVDAATLVTSLQRADRLRDWMADRAIKTLLPLIHKLPASPKLYTQVTEELQSPNGSVDVIAGLIARDPIMSAKILQVVNSAFFGLSEEVTDPAAAVMVLGTERIRSLILLAGVFSQYGDAKCAGFSPDPIWDHSLRTGSFARAIVLSETRNSKMAEAAFTAGLLHDIGKLILAGNVPDMYATVKQTEINKKVSWCEAELMVLGTTHAQLGACLLATWNLPLAILEAIAWHHEPERSAEKGFSLLAAVHVANVLAHERSSESVAPQVNVHFLLQTGMGDCRNRWREFCGLPAELDEDTPAVRIQRCREAKEN